MVGRAVLTAMILTARPPALLSAQVAPNHTTTYLHPTDVRDARALWVNPAGLAVRREASVFLDLTVGDPGPDGRLRQVTAGFNSRGFAVAYQRDVFDAGVRAHTYRVGLAGSSEHLAAGFAVALYGGDAGGRGYDVGAVYTPQPTISLGGVIGNLGQPVVRGLRQRTTFVPALTLRHIGAGAALSAHGRITADSVLGYAFGIRWTAARWPLELVARLDTDQGFRRGAFVFGLAIGRADVVGAVVTASGDLGVVDAANLYGVAVRELTAR